MVEFFLGRLRPQGKELLPLAEGFKFIAKIKKRASRKTRSD